jgi:hypothetical protein
MPKVKISEYSATAADNTDINGIDIAEGCAPSGINDAIRTLMKQIKDLQAGTSGDTIPVTAGGTGATTAGAARTALGATTTGNSLFTSASAAAARTTLGATTTGDALFISTDAAAARTAIGAGTGDVTTTGSQVLSSKTLVDPAITGAILEDIFTITDGAAFEIDPGNGSIQLITLGANRTPKATNFADGESVILMVDDGSAYALTWTDATFGGSGVVWKTNAGVAPTLNTTGYTVIVLWEVAGQVYGARVGDA